MVRIREKLTAKINICAIQALEKRKFWTTTILMKMNSIVCPNYKTYNNFATSLRYLYDHPEYEQKKFRKVIKYYKKSLQQQINDIANRNMGVMYFQVGKYRAALNYLTQVQKVSTYTLYNIAGCYFQIKEFQKSYSCFQKIRYEMYSEDTVEYRIQMLLCMLESAIKLKRKDQIEGLWEELALIESHPRMEILYLANKLGIQQFVVEKWKKTIEEYTFVPCEIGCLNYVFYSIDCKDAMEELKRYVEEEIFTEDFITKEDITEYTLALHNIQYMKTVMDQYRINACCIREEDLYFN